MKFTKKNVLIVALAVCLLAVISMGTLAWFTDSDEVTNEFYIADSTDDADGIFSVDVWEKDADGNVYDVDDNEGGIKFKDIQPGDRRVKDVYVENTGYYAQFVRATVTITGASVWQDALDTLYIPASAMLEGLNADFQLSRLVYNADEDTLTYVFYYNDALAADGVVNLFKNVHIPEALTQYQAAELVNNNFDINIVAEAVQVANLGNSAEDAFEKLGMKEAAGEFTIVKTAKGLARIIAADDVWTDEALEEELGFVDYTVKNNKDDKVVLDLGSDNITVEGYVENFGDLTLKGGAVNNPTTGNYAIINNGATIVFDETNVVSKGGGVAAVNSTVVFNSGSVDIDSTNTSGRYAFYVVEGSTVTINDGDFSIEKDITMKRSYVYTDATSTVIINGGTFGKASTHKDYKAVPIKGEGTVIIYGGTFGFNPTNWVADGYEAVQSGSTWTVQPKA